MTEITANPHGTGYVPTSLLAHAGRTIADACSRRRFALRVVIQLIAVAVLMSGATADETVDRREPALRTEAEQAFVLDQMRLFLSSIARIEDGLGSGDMDRVAREAAARGRKANVGLARPPGLAAKETEAWTAMFKSVRGGFDQIADQASAHAPAATINKMLADTMANCVACHQTYRISVEGR